MMHGPGFGKSISNGQLFEEKLASNSAAASSELSQANCHMARPGPEPRNHFDFFCIFHAHFATSDSSPFHICPSAESESIQLFLQLLTTSRCTKNSKDGLSPQALVCKMDFMLPLIPASFGLHVLTPASHH